MSFGNGGSRVPGFNFLCSKFIFFAASMWIAGKRLKNSWKVHKVTLQNNLDAKEKLEAWINRGYTKLNIGGGTKNIEGFVNIDFAQHDNVQREIQANIVDLSFISDSSISAVHSNHVLEHLSEQQLSQQLTEYCRILKNGGLLTIRCPNALGVAYGFWFDPTIETDHDEFVRLGFPLDEAFGNESEKWMHMSLCGVLHWFFGDMGNIENQHLTIITPTKIRKLVEEAGFYVLKMAEPEAVNIVLVAYKKETISG